MDYLVENSSTRFFVWNTSEVTTASGNYALKLVTADNYGLNNTIMINVTIDNTIIIENPQTTVTTQAPIIETNVSQNDSQNNLISEEASTESILFFLFSIAAIAIFKKQRKVN